MKTSLLSLSVAALLTGSLTATASSVTVPNTFTAGTAAVAADVNANFDALAVGINDNDSRITTNANAIGTNTTNITTNTNAISALDGRVTTAESSITSIDGRVTTNETAISNLQSGVLTCPSDMVAVGSLCVDKYEVSLWDAPTGGNQLNPDNSVTAPSYYPCLIDGSDCGKNAANPIYARSVASVTPATFATLYQAAQACANVGKRLPTTTEWQMAASGTPADGTTCNSPNGGGTIEATGTRASCVSSAGAFDMIGNLWEWTSELEAPNTAATTVASTDAMLARVLGQGFNNVGGATATIKNYFHPSAGAAATNAEFGFRCVR